MESGFWGLERSSGFHLGNFNLLLTLSRIFFVDLVSYPFFTTPPAPGLHYNLPLNIDQYIHTFPLFSAAISDF